jgi:transcriptional regulator with XRE-family HTH domain
MVMELILYDNVYLSKTIANANVFDTATNQQYSQPMSILRINLKKEMDAKGLNATALSEKSGVPQPTIQRFLSGTHGDPRSTTVRKLAKGLGITELELRGLQDAEPYHAIHKGIESLNEENRQLIEQMINKLLLTQKFNPKNTEQPRQKQLTTPAENVGGGGGRT